MLKVSASNFVYAMEYFGRIGRLYCNHDEPNGVCEDGIKVSLKDSMDDVEEFIKGFRAPATLKAITELRQFCDMSNASRSDIGKYSENVFERFNAEVGDQWLLILSHEHSDFLADDVAPFGSEVREAFPILADDIDEAAKCLALGRYTASVFHLMRVMERSVHLLAKKMQVNVDVRTSTWNDITSIMSNSLAKMPGKTAYSKNRKAKYGEIIAHLTAVRIAWRNEVMHPKKSYNKKEAERVFYNVSGFLESLLSVVNR